MTQSSQRLFGQGAQWALALVVVGIVGLMIVPLPTLLMDLLLAANLALSVLILALALHVARAHGGRLRCESREGAGTRFTLELPIHPGRRAGRDA